MGLAVTWLLLAALWCANKAGSAQVSRGSGVHWDEYEAEEGTTNGVVLPANRSFGSFGSESSGRRSVRLDGDAQFVEIQASRGAANSVVVRYSIPDAPHGHGINSTLSLYVDGDFVTSLRLTSQFSWTYGYWTIPYAQDPVVGGAHHFFDEVRVLLPPPRRVGVGSVVRLQVDVTRGDTAPWYIVDLLDLELVDEPKSQPAHSLSITNFGGATGDGWETNDRAAIQATIDAAAQRGRGWAVWVPPGSYGVGAEGELVLPAGVSVVGAGMWHSNFLGNTRFRCSGAGNCSYHDFAIHGLVKNRVNKGSPHGFIGAAGTGSRCVRSRLLLFAVHHFTSSLSDRQPARMQTWGSHLSVPVTGALAARPCRLHAIWIEHTSAGYWVGRATSQGAATDGLVVSGCRVRNTYADGINLCNGASNSIVRDSHFRNTGDDSVCVCALSHSCDSSQKCQPVLVMTYMGE